MSGNAKTEFQAVVLFVDIVESCRLADILPLKEYRKILKEFRSTCRNSRNEFFGKRSKQENAACRDCRCLDQRTTTAGDQFHLVAWQSKSQNHCAVCILQFAVYLTLRWLISKPNEERLLSKDCANIRKPIELSMGIHFGTVWETQKNSFEGPAMSLAKRIQDECKTKVASRLGVSRSAYSKILEAGAQIRTNVRFEPLQPAELKGFTGREAVFGAQFVLPSFQQENENVESYELREALKAAFSVCAEYHWYGSLFASVLYNEFLKHSSSDLIDKWRKFLEDEMLLVDSDFLPALELLGYIYAQSEPASSIHYNERAIRLDPWNYVANFNLGVALTKYSDMADGKRSEQIRRRTRDQWLRTLQIFEARWGKTRLELKEEHPPGEIVLHLPKIYAFLAGSMLSLEVPELGGFKADTVEPLAPRDHPTTESEREKIDQIRKWFEKAASILERWKPKQLEWLLIQIYYQHAQILILAGNESLAKEKCGKLIEVSKTFDRGEDKTGRYVKYANEFIGQELLKSDQVDSEQCEAGTDLGKSSEQTIHCCYTAPTNPTPCSADQGNRGLYGETKDEDNRLQNLPRPSGVS